MNSQSNTERVSLPSPPAKSFSVFWLVIFFAVHIPLALAIHRAGTVSTAHALATVSVGLILALTGQSPVRIGIVTAYIIGAEVMWRMTDAAVFWEFGKYAVSAVLLVALLRRGRFKVPLLPFLYFVLLLPSSVLTVESYKWIKAQGSLSFNLSGPFALLVSCWFFSKVKLRTDQLYRLFLATIAPIVGVATLAITSTYSAEEIHFSDRSNYITSGGFGPNQVSATLGLGVMLCFLCVLKQGTSRSFKILMFTAMTVFATQSALTLSRGGLALAVCGSFVAAVFLMRDARSRIKILALGGIIFLTAYFVILPRLNTFTGGAVSSRFEDTSSTGRGKILEADLEIWSNNLLMGVGPGRAIEYRKELYKDIAAHTEFSRLVAEHGIFGLAAFLLLLIMCLQRFQSVSGMKNKGIMAAMITWSILFMAINAMRLAAPSFLFGLTFVTLLPETVNIKMVRSRPPKLVSIR